MALLLIKTGVCKPNPVRPPAGCHVPSPLKNVVLVPPEGTRPIFAPPLYLNNVIEDRDPAVLVNYTTLSNCSCVNLCWVCK